MAKRKYDNEYPSVTQVLGILRKMGLEFWFKNNTAEFCNAESKKGLAVGTDVHKAIEVYITTGDKDIETNHPEEVRTALESFILFKSENPDISFLDVKAETALTSEKYGYNGTIDCVRVPVLVDWKTATCKEKDKPKIYDEYKYQVSAYVYLWNEVQEDKINQAHIVSLAKDKVAYGLYTMEMDEMTEHFNKAFLPAISIYNHQKAWRRK